MWQLQASHTLRVLNDPRCLSFHDSDSRVCGSQVNTDHGTLDLLIIRISSPERSAKWRPEDWAACGRNGARETLFRMLSQGLLKLLSMGVERTDRDRREDNMALDCVGYVNEKRKQRANE